ncbi:MAG: condensation domain-containing protein, partial [Pseudomonadota bacterium]
MRRGNKKNKFKGSANQKGLWFVQQYAPDVPLYNVVLPIQLTTPVDVSCLQMAFKQLIDRHPMLSARFDYEDKDLYYLLSGSALFKMDQVSAKTLSAKQLQTVIRQEAQTPFDLSRQAFRVKIYHLKRGQSILLIVWHHIIEDMLSIKILLEELSQIYTALCEKTSPSLAALTTSYDDYVRWQEDYINSDQGQADLSYWQSEYAQRSTLSMLSSQSLKRNKNYEAKEITICLNDKEKREVLAYCQQQEISIHHYLMSCLGILLLRYVDESNVSIYSQTLGRPHLDTHNILGYFTNRVLLNLNVEGHCCFEEVIKLLGRQLSKQRKHSKFPYSLLASDFAVEGDAKVSFEYHSYPISALIQKYTTPLFQSKLYGIDEKIINHDLSLYDYADDDLHLITINHENELALCLQYKLDFYSSDMAEQFLLHYKRVILQGLKMPQENVYDFSLLNAQDYHQIVYEWNETDKDYPRDKTIQGLFEVRVRKTPDNIALVFEGEALTYQVLNQRVNQLARYIRKQYKEVTKTLLKPDTLIALYLDKSLEMVIAILGILKAGGAYVPMDPSYPDERIRFMLADTQARLLLTQLQ